MNKGIYSATTQKTHRINGIHTYYIIYLYNINKMTFNNYWKQWQQLKVSFFLSDNRFQFPSESYKYDQNALCELCYIIYLQYDLATRYISSHHRSVIL